MPAARASRSRSGSHRSSTYGAAWAAQPRGEIQESELPPVATMSPRARRAKAAPSTRPASPAAPREWALSWAATAVMPAKARPTSPTAAATTAVPLPGQPLARASAPTTTAAATLVTTATTSAAVSGACRPTTSARTSSERPLCSSNRVCRVTSMMFISAASSSR